MAAVTEGWGGCARGCCCLGLRAHGRSHCGLGRLCTRVLLPGVPGAAGAWLEHGCSDGGGRLWGCWCRSSSVPHAGLSRLGSAANALGCAGQDGVGSCRVVQQETQGTHEW